jgi:hypothetical protein
MRASEIAVAGGGVRCAGLLINQLLLAAQLPAAARALRARVSETIV